jgi:hypothetical protein
MQDTSKLEVSRLVIDGELPTSDLVDAVMTAARVLDTWICYASAGRYHFVLGNGRTIALSADSANRIRIEACLLTRPEVTMWTLAHRPDRLAGLVRRLSAMPAPS